MNRIKSVFSGLVKYLSDWRNLLNHGLVGIFFLLVAIYTPVNIFVKLGVIVLVITFNIRRMKKRVKAEGGK